MPNKNPVLLAIGRQIREIRQSNGYSQEGFAHLINIDRSFMGRIERGERNISVLTLVKIAHALDVDAGILLPLIKDLKK